MTTDRTRVLRLVALGIAIATGFVIAGYATFEQWSGFVGPLLRAVLS